ncbi:MAG: restriction endonuclease subunit S [Sulfurospirillum sp.]|nr:restriction endonuclease subunit S [Sulfurospirillum sp.]
MSSEWSNLTLGDLGQIKTGKTPPGSLENAYGDGIPFITPKDMDSRKFIRTAERHFVRRSAKLVS